MTGFVCISLKNRCFDCRFMQLSFMMRGSPTLLLVVLLFHLFVVVILNRERKEMGKGLNQSNQAASIMKSYPSFCHRKSMQSHR